MKRLLRFAALPLAIALPLAASAQPDEGVVTADVTLRAGPAPEYPDLVVLPYGSEVSVQGCTDGWEWCDVIAEDNRGWIPGDYIQYDYDDQPVLLPEYGERIGIPIVAFVIADYWGSHYRNRSFFRERDNWYHRRIPISAPPRPRGGWHVTRLPHGSDGSHGPHGPYHVNPPNPPRAPVHPVQHTLEHGGRPPSPNYGPHPESMPHAPNAEMMHVSHPQGPVHGPQYAGPHPAYGAGHGQKPQPREEEHKKKEKDNNNNGH